MKNILLIGVGGTGSRAVDIFYQKVNEFGQQNDNKITALVFDTDAGDIKNITNATPVAMADPASVGTICDRIGKEYLREWFPCDDPAVRSQEMIRGASQWRKKSYLAFLNLMNKPLSRSAFIGALERMVADPGASCEVYVISSVAGGTGSGSFIPIALYAKRYLRKNLGKDPIVNAMIALPEIYADAQTPENRIKIFSNAYAILRELNAINLVARGYNEGRALQKKSPIKFRLGHPNEPNVGVLFDASDKSYWNPNAAPFSQVFLLDRIPGLDSVVAYDMVLANSLYTILCTDIGAAFDSEFSNHELLRSQNNGSNAIYAGISTSQIKFPCESVLDYIAHKKTLDSCNNEWLILHKAVQEKIKEKEQNAKAARKSYTMADGEYADLVLKEYENLKDAENYAVVDIVARSGKEKGVEQYVDRVENEILKKVPGNSELTFENIHLRDIPAKDQKAKVLELAKEADEALVEYYNACIEEIKSVTTSTAESILSLSNDEDNRFIGSLSLSENILKFKGKNIHPVAAMYQLCKARKAFAAKLVGITEEWADFKSRSIEEIPEELSKITGDSEEIKGGKSFYAEQSEETRYADLVSEAMDYMSQKTKPTLDIVVFKADALSIASNIYLGAQEQLKLKVYTKVLKNIDILIEKYRNFFNRFGKEKEELVELTKTAKRRDAENVDSVINVYSSQEQKEEILKNIEKMSGPATDEEIAKIDDIVGLGVYKTVYAAAVAEANQGEYNEKDASAFRSLFKDMIASYRDSVKASEAFAAVASYNVVEAIVESKGANATAKELEPEFRKHFSIAQELAKPSLRISEKGDDNELVQPSKIIVFMISYETGKYIKKNYEKFELKLPADQNNEKRVIQSCSEQFIRRYSGDSSARVTIVKDMSDQMLYCTGEIMDITPLRIEKFDEMSADNTYFRYYTQSLNYSKHRFTDMWNPHLGNNLHKRGYLPYMNEAKEKECDTKMVKALFYGFATNRIVYNNGKADMAKKYYFECDNEKIKSPEGNCINNKNIAQLLAWIRNEDELIEKWSKAFDRRLLADMIALPSVVSDNGTEIENLKSAITRSPFMKLLTECLYVDESDKNARKVVEEKGGYKIKQTTGAPSILEFAYLIKTSEEVGCDCDDAERILQVAYDVFRQICEYRTSSETAQDNFIQVYRHEVKKVFESFAASKMVCAAGMDCEGRFKEFVAWVKKNDLFNTVSVDAPLDEFGKVNITEQFEKDADIDRILNAIKAESKAKKVEEN